MSEAIQREAMEYDVVIVGAGPSGLAAAIRLKQINPELTVAVLEKGAEVGAHILSGAVIDPKGLAELIPDWKAKGAPLETPVTRDEFILLGPQGSLSLPMFLMPPFMNNHGNYIASLGNVCRWLAGQAEELGVEIYPGMAASAPVFEGDTLVGVVAGEFGLGKDGKPGPSYEPGMELRGKYVFIGEGVRGSLAKVLRKKYGLGKDADVEKYGIGIKELWQVPNEVFSPGLATHTTGWPLDDKSGGGSFMYHFGDNLVAIGYVTHLGYKNPWLSPFDEFQRFKHHPEVAKYLVGGKRIAYGARAISEGGLQSIPKLYFPGGVLLGDSAGFVNVPRIKGSHAAIKSGIMAADAAAAAIAEGRSGDELAAYKESFDRSWLRKELHTVRNAKPILSKFGTKIGGALGMFEMWTTYLLGGFSFFGTLKHGKNDADSTGKASDYKPIVYPKPDGVLSFDKLSSVFLSSTNHDESQPAHLHLRDPSIPIDVNLPKYGEPARLYCPAGVYEVLYDEGGQNPKFQINFQNCVHCKTCDIKDPSQNIDWTTPQGGDGPNYPNM
ncbi:MAG: electron transfer flavoprotein-ubiquinone oxidoreductase [Phenylobacterium sp.]|uniref:electron transfer flavoprotein-ubiquinone oxidoreductase n=1 Tax=Phenylobacterium sp. TaxID=1871053 RepID=UPI001A39660C|nr:electron transfer flavoprotein-ubiquinone oxidoreductase [Phenylobacterium sp.]MBL8554199.1 electron transfer flavoprotein-ubiquinone oxidoreductase [Phenylobacterium sp.]